MDLDAAGEDLVRRLRADRRPEHRAQREIAGWRHERLPLLPQDAYFTLPPDWICEVLSRSTGAVDRSKKLPIYARAGVRHVWLIEEVVRVWEEGDRYIEKLILVAEELRRDIASGERSPERIGAMKLSTSLRRSTSLPSRP